MKHENMPYYRGLRVTTKTDSAESDNPSTTPHTDPAHESHCQFVIMAMTTHNCHGLSHLSNVPIRFGNFVDGITPISSHATSNHEIPANAHRLLHFNWAVYSFGGGHFVLTVTSQNLPFQITLACDQYDCGRALFCKFTTCPDILSSGNDLLHHIRASGDTSQIHGYLIHSLCFRDSDTTSSFWQLQSSLIAQLCSLRNLQMVVALVLSDHDRTCVKSFTRILKAAGWSISQFDDVYFPSNGDSIADSCDLLFGVQIGLSIPLVVAILS